MGVAKKNGEGQVEGNQNRLNRRDIFKMFECRRYVGTWKVEILKNNKSVFNNCCQHPQGIVEVRQIPPQFLETFSTAIGFCGAV